jgi:hypothetical protein
VVVNCDAAIVNSVLGAAVVFNVAKAKGASVRKHHAEASRVPARLAAHERNTI